MSGHTLARAHLRSDRLAHHSTDSSCEENRGGLCAYWAPRAQPSKLACYSRAYPLHDCPYRVALGAPVGGIHVEAAAAGGAAWADGVIVGGIPLGKPAYVHEVLRRSVGTICELISDTVTELRVSPHSLWTTLYYSLSHRFDHVLRHLPPSVTQPHAAVVDAALLSAAEVCGYEGMLADPLTSRRFRLPARMRGCGIRSLELLAPAAYCACFIEAVHHMLARPSADGASLGFFVNLTHYLVGEDGPAAFAEGGSRFAYYIGVHAHTSALAAEFRDAWAAMRAEVAGAGVPGPLDLPIESAGRGARSTGLQRDITAQREQAMRDRLHAEIAALPRMDARRQAWMAADCISSAWVSAWPDEHSECAPGDFAEGFGTYLGCESAAVRPLAGQSSRAHSMGASAMLMVSSSGSPHYQTATTRPATMS